MTRCILIWNQTDFVALQTNFLCPFLFWLPQLYLVVRVISSDLAKLIHRSENKEDVAISDSGVVYNVHLDTNVGQADTFNRKIIKQLQRACSEMKLPCNLSNYGSTFSEFISGLSRGAFFRVYFSPKIEISGTFSHSPEKLIVFRMFSVFGLL